MKSVEQVTKKAFEIIEILFNSEGLYIPRSEFNNLLRDGFEDYAEVIKKGICATPKIDLKKGRTGGIVYSKGRNRTTELSGADRKNIETKISTLMEELSNKVEQKQPELKVERAFELWLRKRYSDDNHKVILNFPSKARKGNRYENVDGYLISTQELKYHLLFKPVVTTFEVKAAIPKKEEMGQARNYLGFSHYVYFVFKDSRPTEEIRNLLAFNGFEVRSGIGVYVTRDEVEFEKIYDATLNAPLEHKVDEQLEKMLTESDREKLETWKYEYLLNNYIDAIR